MRARAGSDSRGRTGACVPGPADGIADGPVGTPRAAVLVMDPVTPMVLARCEDVQPPVTCILERLTGRGLVRRNPGPADRRQVLISRTPAGHGLARHIRLSRTWLAGRSGGSDRAGRDAITCAAPALRLAVLT